MVTRIYANAVAKYNEGKLLDREKLRRLIDADFSDAVKMLCDYGYGGSAGNGDIDAFISAETAELIKYALDASPDEYLSRVLTNRFLYGNAKAYYKERVSGKENAAAVYKMDDDVIKRGIEKGDYSALPQPMADALTELDAKFADSEPDPKAIDACLTRARYTDDVFCAKKSKSKTLSEYVKSEIDILNIASALRARALKMDETSLLPLIIEGGDVPAEDVVAIYSSDSPAKPIRDTKYDFVDADAEISIPEFEAKAEAMLAGMWENGSDDMTSLSPFVGYYMAQLAEYRTVKLILTCLKNGARDEILPRLRGILE